MSEEAAEARANLARHRRFLLVMSVIVIAYYGLRARFSGDVSYSGFGIYVERPDLIKVGLWSIWAWAFLTYLQRVIKLYEDVRGSIEQDLDVEVDRLERKAARRQAVKLQKAGKISNDHERVRIDPKSIAMGTQRFQVFRLRKGGVVRKDVSYTVNRDGSRTYHGLRGSFWGVGKESHEQVASEFRFEMSWSPGKVRWHETTAWICALLRQPAITEHFAPFLVAGVAFTSPLVFGS